MQYHNRQLSTADESELKRRPRPLLFRGTGTELNATARERERERERERKREREKERKRERERERERVFSRSRWMQLSGPAVHYLQYNNRPPDTLLSLPADTFWQDF
jgi:hypothetical protein